MGFMILGKRGLSQKANANSSLVLHKDTEYLDLNKVSPDSILSRWQEVNKCVRKYELIPFTQVFG